MRQEHLQYLKCPACSGEDLVLLSEHTAGDRVCTGTVNCSQCRQVYPVINFVPRFVQGSYYADSFGKQWNNFARTQLDDARAAESELRFRTELGWSQNELSGKVVAEFGSGAGRFVEVVSRMNAKLVVGLDITDAVDASQANLGDRDNVFFVQGDILNSPLRDLAFDAVYSVGVLHHTPEPRDAFRRMLATARVNGLVGLSLYETSLYRRPPRNSLRVATTELLWALNLWRVELFRVVTTRLPHDVFLAYCKAVVPMLHQLNRVPALGTLRYLLPSTCYTDLPVEWSMVDTMDTYATKIVHQYKHKELFHWFVSEGMKHVILHNSRAGWVSVTGIKPKADEISGNRIVEEEPLAPGRQAAPL